MQQRIAIIDLGSNTSRLIILAYAPGTAFQLIDQVRERVRLSEGMGAVRRQRHRDDHRYRHQRRARCAQSG
jgi:exopolyphosphatase/pppGpp-phosphohydrolase